MFLFCYLFRAIWKPFYRRLRFWILVNNKKYGKAGKSEADRPSSKLHKSHKNVLNLTEIAVKGSADNIICLFLLCFWSLWSGFITTTSEALDFKFFHPRPVFFFVTCMTGWLDLMSSTVAQSLLHSDNLALSRSWHGVLRVARWKAPSTQIADRVIILCK